MADEPISALTLFTSYSTADEVEILDVSDTTFAATGTNKRIQFSTLLSMAGLGIYSASLRCHGQRYNRRHREHPGRAQCRLCRGRRHRLPADRELPDQFQAFAANRRPPDRRRLRLNDPRQQHRRRLQRSGRGHRPPSHRRSTLQPLRDVHGSRAAAGDRWYH